MKVIQTAVGALFAGAVLTTMLAGAAHAQPQPPQTATGQANPSNGIVIVNVNVDVDVTRPADAKVTGAG